MGDDLDNAVGWGRWLREGAARAAAVALSAWMVGASAPPYGWWFLHAFAFVPLLLALPGGRRRWLWLIAFGAVTQAHIFVWIVETITLFSNIPASLAWGVLLLFSLAYGLPYVAMFGPVPWLRARFGDGWVLALPAWMVVVEWVAQFATLFPYPQGATQYPALALWQLASVTGSWGLTFGIGLTSAVFADAIARARSGGAWHPWRLGAWAGVVGMVAVWGAWRLASLDAVEARDRETGHVLDIGLLQVQHGMQWRMRHPARDAFQLWVAATRKLDGRGADLVVWPEGAVPYDLNGSLVGPAMWDMAVAGGFDLVVGSGTRQREPDPELGEDRVRIFNSVYVYDRARLGAAPDADPDPATTLARLRAAGCDAAALDALHVVTPWEVHGVLREARARPDTGACVGALEARLTTWSATRLGEPFFLQALARLSWPVLRTQTARFTAPLAERRVHTDRAYAYHQLDEPTCTTGDCLGLVLRCTLDPAGPCETVPEAPHYDKLVPLPFGEYIPFASTFPVLAEWIRGPGNFRAGTDPLVFDVGGVRFATPICYEGILSYVCARYPSPDLLINVTNDAWFGTGAASDLHGMLVMARAVEMGVPVVRSAYTGTSFVVVPSGRVYAKTPLFADVSDVVPLPRSTVSTVYARFGDWFVALCAIGLGLVGWRRRGAP